MRYVPRKGNALRTRTTKLGTSNRVERGESDGKEWSLYIHVKPIPLTDSAQLSGEMIDCLVEVVDPGNGPS